MDGFDGRAALPAAADEIPDSFEPVRGYRWWTLKGVPLHLNPARADEVWPGPVRLRGQYAAWQPGENVAECKPYGGAMTHVPWVVPYEPCGCGHYAYWKLQPHSLGGQGIPVCGVIEGYGAVLIGTKGFRAAKARIVALHVPGIPQLDAVRQAGKDAWKRAGFTGKVIYHGMEPARYELDPADADQAEAWMAAIGDRLEREYPAARIFETSTAMEKVYPPEVSSMPGRGECHCDRRYSWHDVSCPAR